MRTCLLVIASLIRVAYLLFAPASDVTGPLLLPSCLALLGYTSSLLIKATWAGGSSEFTISETGDGESIREWAVPNAATDQLCNIAIDVDKVQIFFLVSTQDVTIETNDGESPGNTLALKANEPYSWHVSALDDFKLTVDVTAFYVTNSSGEAATVTCYVLQDTTPA